MAVIHASPSGPTIQAAANLAQNGDTVSIDAGTYHETVNISRNIDITFLPTSGPGTVILDGQGTLNTGIDYQANHKFTVYDLEVKQYKAYGIQYNNPNVTGKIGTPAYNPPGVMNPGATFDIQRNHVHHIGTNLLLSQGNTANWGIWCNAGYRPILKNNVVHHIGDTNEAIGIVCYYAYQPTIQFNQCYECRKEGIRYGYGYEAVVDSNVCFNCWSGITHEYQIGSRCSNNLLFDCDWGTYLKQVNNNTQANPPTRDFWGAALGLSGAAPPEIVGFWHNTVAACRFNCVGLATQYPMDYADVRNNLLVGGSYVNANGVTIQPGDGYIQGSTTTVVGPNVFLDYNVYVTVSGQPATFLVSGQSIPNASNSAADLAALQGWQSRGWEPHGRVGDPVFANAAAKNFAHSVNFVGYDLTANSINNVGSPYGTQTGCDVTRLPTLVYKSTLVGAPPVVDSSSGWSTTSRAVDMRYLTYAQTPTVPGATNGVGLNQWMIFNLGAVKAINGIMVSFQLASNNQATKTGMLEYSNDKVTWTNANITPGLELFPSGTTFTYADNQQTTHIMELLGTVSAQYWRYTIVDTWGSTYGLITAFLPIMFTLTGATPPPPPTDTLAPTITILSPTQGAHYIQNQVVNASYSAADEAGGSGIATVTATVSLGSPIDTSTVGTHTFAVTATDNASNTRTQSVTYVVDAVGTPPVSSMGHKPRGYATGAR